MESSDDLKQKIKKLNQKLKTKDTEVETLKITVREYYDKDIKDRKLEKNLKRSCITNISTKV